MGSGKARSVMVGLPPPENPAYPSDFNLSIRAGIEASLLRQFLSRAVLPDQRSQAGSHLFANRFFLRKQILSFTRVFGQVVELGLGRIDKVVVRALDCRVAHSS